MENTTKTIKKLPVSRRLLLGILLLSAAPAMAVPLLYDVRYNPLSTGETEIEFVFDEDLQAEPTVQVLNEPSRIELTFAEADYEEKLADVEIEERTVLFFGIADEGHPQVYYEYKLQGKYGKQPAGVALSVKGFYIGFVNHGPNVHHGWWQLNVFGRIYPLRWTYSVEYAIVENEVCSCWYDGIGSRAIGC